MKMCLSRLQRLSRAGTISVRGIATLRRFDIPALRAVRRRASPVLELVNETVSEPVDLNAMYEALTTLLVRHARAQAQPA